MFLFCMLKFVCVRKTYILFQKDEHLNFAQDSGPVDAVLAFCLLPIPERSNVIHIPLLLYHMNRKCLSPAFTMMSTSDDVRPVICLVMLWLVLCCRAHDTQTKPCTVCTMLYSVNILHIPHILVLCMKRKSTHVLPNYTVVVARHTSRVCYK